MRQPKDWGQPCPHPACTHESRMTQGNVSALATSRTQSGQRRLLRCSRCETPFAAPRATVFFALRTAADNGMMARKRLRGRVDLTGIGCGLGVTAQTVVAWRKRAAEQADERKRPLRRPLSVTEGPLDERWHVIARTDAQQGAPDGARWPQRAEGRPWLWLSDAPALRRLRAACVGPRTSDRAGTWIAMTAAGVMGGPGVCSEGFRWSVAAVSPQSTACARPGTRGHPRTPVVAPHPDVVEAQSVTQTRPGCLHTLTQRVRWGTTRLAQLGVASSTSVMERRTLTRRPTLAPLGSTSGSCCTDREPRRRRIVFLQACDHCARPHHSLRVERRAGAPVRAGLMPPKWHQRTPGMAAGLTAQVWTFRELVTAKCEPILNQSSSG